MSDVPPSVELMDLAGELRRKYSEVELKQLGVLLGVKATKRKYEQKLAGLERELRGALRSVSAHSELRVKAEMALKHLQQEQLADRLIPGLITAASNLDIAQVLARANFLAKQVTEAQAGRAVGDAAPLPAAEGGGEVSS